MYRSASISVLLNSRFIVKITFDQKICVYTYFEKYVLYVLYSPVTSQKEEDLFKRINKKLENM